MNRPALWLAAAAILLPLTVQAQGTASSVVFDGSTGPAGAAPTRALPGGGLDHMIDHCPSCPGPTQGVAVGKNLFHGLSDVIVGEMDAATFMNSDGSGGFANIFAKVSGDNPSHIFGMLRSEIPDADLYLLNPNGVLFGENAQLDVKGSFYVTTADRVDFANGESFEASPGGSIPTVEADPVSFGFLLDGGDPAGITFAQTRNLGVGEGETLTAVAGQVRVEGGFQGEAFATLQSSKGVIQLAAVPAGTTVPLDVSQLDVTGFDPDGAAVSISDDALVEVDGAPLQGQGRIVIRGGRFQMAPTEGFDTSPDMKVFGGGTGAQPAIDIEVAGDAALDNATVASVASGTAGSGDVHILAGSISLDGGSLVDGGIDSNPSGLTGPGIQLEATSTLDIRGLSRVQTRDDAIGFNKGKVGDIELVAERVRLSGSRPASQGEQAVSSEIATVSTGRGDGGSIRIVASGGEVTLEQGARIAASRRQGLIPGLPGDPIPVPGAIEVHGQALDLSGGAQIISDTEADIDGAGIVVGSTSSPVANVTVRDGAIASQTRSSGLGGDVAVHAGEILVENTVAVPVGGDTAQIGAVTSRISDTQGGDGPGGNVTVRADSVTLRNGGQLRALTNGSAQGGYVDIALSGSLLAEGKVVLPDNLGNPGLGETIASGVFARSALFESAPGVVSETPTTGSAGRIDLTAREVTLRGGGLISARAEGTGADQSQGGAGDVHVVAESVMLEGAADASSEISTKGAGGAGGALTIDAGRVGLRTGGIISASGTGSGDAGNLRVNAAQIEIEGARSGIFAQSLGVVAGAGKAGSLTLAPPQGQRLTLRVSDDGQISAESRAAEAGTIRILGADRLELVDGGRISTVVGNVFDQDPDMADRSDIRIVDAGDVLLSNATITGETTGNVDGGTISIEADTIVLAAGSEVTASSSAGGGDAGDAGSIVIAATDSFEASNSKVATTADEAAGGRISIQAGRLVQLVDSDVLTLVRAVSTVTKAGDINIPLFGDEGAGVASVTPDFVVINRSNIIADAQLGDAGNIFIRGQDVFVSQGSVIQAVSGAEGVDGIIRVTSPDAEIVGQVTPLPADFSDPSDRLLPPCVARTERTGSFVVQKGEAPPAPPDGPLSPGLGGSGRSLPLRDGLECSMPEESS